MNRLSAGTSIEIDWLRFDEESVKRVRLIGRFSRKKIGNPSKGQLVEPEIPVTLPFTLKLYLQELSHVGQAQLVPSDQPVGQFKTERFAD